MSEPTNLNRFRKQRQRDAKRRQGDENAQAFGRTKAERLLEATRNQKAAQMLDRHRLDETE